MNHRSSFPAGNPLAKAAARARYEDSCRVCAKVGRPFSRSLLPAEAAERFLLAGAADHDDSVWDSVIDGSGVRKERVAERLSNDSKVSILLDWVVYCQCIISLDPWGSV